MEPPTTPSLYADRDGERGAGGKLKRPSARKPPTTPYARPAANPNDRRPAGGWWSILVDPAKRLVSGGATMLLPSFFSQSISSSALPPEEEENNLDLGILPSANHDENISNHGVPKLTGLTAPSEIKSDRLIRNCNSEVHCGSQSDFKDDSKVSRIEQLIEGKSFSRDEVDRLMAILKSRVDGEEERNEVNTLSKQAEGVLWTPSSRKPNEGNQRDVDKDILRTPLSNVHDAVGASPVDIAKAYMGSRSLELGASPCSTLSRGELAADQTDEVVFNAFAESTSFDPSTCWPGAVIQNPRDSSTPSQRPRFGLHDFPRTPYSRTIHSKSRDKLQADSRRLSTSLNPYQQSRTPIFGQEKLRNHIPYDSYGSVGPIRRIRNKFASEARTRGSNFASRKDVPLFQQGGVPGGIVLPSEKDPENQPEISLPEPVPLLNPSPSQAVKRILEQLDRKKPTPKEKADELMFAASWRNSPSEASNQKQKVSFSFPHSGDLQRPKKPDFLGPMFLSEDRPNGGNSSSHIQSPEESVTPKRDVPMSATPPGLDSAVSLTSYAVDPLVPSVGLNNNPPLQFSSSREAQAPSSDTGGAGGNTNLPSMGQSNRQHSTSTIVPNRTKSALLHRPPQPSSVSKPNLAYISVGRRGLGHTASSENGAGFTFPVSASSNAFAEPPTPSVMPFSSNSLQSHSKEEPLVPSYSFGSKTAARLVFSFPSTSSTAVVDAPDLKFDFGTDKKSRLCFGSMGKDAVCC